MDNESTLIIMKAVLSLCVALVTVYVLPYIETLKNDARYNRLFDMVKLAVMAAEQVYRESGQGRTKKAEVSRFVTEWMKKQGISISSEELDQLIESAVFTMNNMKQEK